MQNAKMDIGLFGMFHHLYFQQERVQTNFFCNIKGNGYNLSIIIKLTVYEVLNTLPYF